jgi:hypothetical protein
MQDRILNIRKHGKTAKGQKEILKHLTGQKLTFKQAIYAKCYECLGYMADGKQDCKMQRVPFIRSCPTMKTGKSELQKRQWPVIMFRPARLCFKNTPLLLWRCGFLEVLAT